MSWTNRKARLREILNFSGNEEDLGILLDQGIPEELSDQVRKLRFTEKDLSVMGPLDYGQFGVVSIILAYVCCVLHANLIDRRRYLQIG